MSAEQLSAVSNEETLEIIQRLVFAAEYKHPESISHIQRVSQYTQLLAKAHNLPECVCKILRLASPMHDIGKVGIPDNILLKPGKLTLEEWEIMKTHTTIGAELLSGSTSPVLQMGQIIAISHHERWDGTGYPRGLARNDIPLSGRIVAVADVFDALTTDRPYEKAWPVDKAVEVITLGSEFQFDPYIVSIFQKVLPEFVKIKQRYSEKTRDI